MKTEAELDRLNEVVTLRLDDIMGRIQLEYLGFRANAPGGIETPPEMNPQQEQANGVYSSGG